jgi:hypothetical protein
MATYWQLLQFSSFPSTDFSRGSTTISSPFPLLNVSRENSSLEDVGVVGCEGSSFISHGSVGKRAVEAMM